MMEIASIPIESNGAFSVRRNPVIADLFHRMKFMERRGSGLRKIVSETEKLPGYTEELRPEFHSSGTDFRAVLKNVNWIMAGSEHDGEHDGEHVERFDSLVDFCTTERTRDEMMSFLSISSRPYFQQNFLKPLLASGRIKMTIPDKPKSKNEKYVKA